MTNIRKEKMRDVLDLTEYGDKRDVYLMILQYDSVKIH